MLTKSFRSILELLAAFPTQQSCIDYLEEVRWGGKVASPFDSQSVVYTCKRNRYKCKNTNRYFSVLTGTMFEDTKIPLRKWFMAIYLVTCHKKGVSSCQLARDIDVTQKSAWFMLKRIHACLGVECVGCLSNEVEVDETFIGGKNKNRHASKKVKESQGRSVKDKTPVLGLVERKGTVIAMVVKDTKARSLIPPIHKSVRTDSVVYSDEWPAYRQLGAQYTHTFVLHSSGEYVNGKTHTNTIEGYWSHLKRMIHGTHHSVSRKHLQYYVDSQTFRYNTREMKESQRFNLFLSNIDHRLTYKRLIEETETQLI